MAKAKNAAPKKRGNSHEQYQKNRSMTEPRNKAIRATRQRIRLARQQVKKLKHPHGYARMMHRRNMATFNAERRAKLQKPTGTIRVNSPTMEMLNKYIEKPQA